MVAVRPATAAVQADIFATCSGAPGCALRAVRFAIAARGRLTHLLRERRKPSLDAPLRLGVVPQTRSDTFTRAGVKDLLCATALERTKNTREVADAGETVASLDVPSPFITDDIDCWRPAPPWRDQLELWNAFDVRPSRVFACRTPSPPSDSVARWAASTTCVHAASIVSGEAMRDFGPDSVKAP